MRSLWRRNLLALNLANAATRRAFLLAFSATALALPLALYFPPLLKDIFPLEARETARLTLLSILPKKP